MRASQHCSQVVNLKRKINHVQENHNWCVSSYLEQSPLPGTSADAPRAGYEALEHRPDNWYAAHASVPRFYNVSPPHHFVSINWRLAELALRLSDLHRGVSLILAIRQISVLGGKEDGGQQSIPATRYYFNPGIIVEIPVRNGVVTGHLRISPGSFSYD